MHSATNTITRALFMSVLICALYRLLLNCQWSVYQVVKNKIKNGALEIMLTVSSKFLDGIFIEKCIVLDPGAYCCVPEKINMHAGCFDFNSLQIE